MWARQPKDQLNIKESARWVEGHEIVADLAETVPDARWVYVADREGDLRTLMGAAARRGTPADWLIRSQHNRKTTTGEQLWERLASSAALGKKSTTSPSARSPTLHVPARQPAMTTPHRKLLRYLENRTRPPTLVPDPPAGYRSDHRVHRAIL